MAKWIVCLPFTQEGEGSTPTGGTYPNDFSDPIDQDIRTQCASGWKNGIRVAVGDCRITERWQWHPLYQTGKTVHVHAKYKTH